MVGLEIRLHAHYVECECYPYTRIRPNPRPSRGCGIKSLHWGFRRVRTATHSSPRRALEHLRLMST